MNLESSFFWKVMRIGAPTALALVAMSDTRDAVACGGCFHPQNDTAGSVVTDHRMVFEITAKETILWDQVRYAGDPKEFAWVLPVRPGARIELSRTEWIAALDAATRTSVQAPERVCPPPPPSTPSNGTSRSSSRSSSSRDSSDTSGGGCGMGGSSNSTETAPAVGGGATDDSNDTSSGSPIFQGNEDVDVVAQSTIGPYQAVTIRASGTQGISEWLTTNGFSIPTNIAPVIDGYTLQKFDFIALRLRPNQGVRAMRPVRIVTPGADTTLPLRMVAAGVGARVGLTLWVIGEGRYHTQNFPDAAVEWNRLAWDPRQGRSNRATLEAAALATDGGRGWITEAAVRTSFTESKWGTGLPNVYDAYQQTCQFRGKRTVRCDDTALPPPDGKPGDVTPDEPDAGTPPDAGEPDEDAGDAGASADASGEGGAADGGASGGGVGCTKVVTACDGFDDLAVAARSLHNGDAWVTRLRADLPVAALATDLRLEASPDQSVLSPAHKTTSYTDPTFDPCASTRPRSSSSSGSTRDDGPDARSGDGCACRSAPIRDGAGTWLLIGLTCVVLPLVTRRRRR